jgi:hypothetical protein
MGSKKALAQSLGQKLGRLGGVHMSGMHASSAHGTEHGESVNNMIYNKSNLAEAVYYPKATYLGKEVLFREIVNRK